jgi:type II secretory pathway component PulK
MTRKQRRRGFLLIMVLVVIAALALGAYTFTDLMHTENAAAVLGAEQTQARMLADSGVETVRTFLFKDQATRRDEGGVYSNPERFQAVPVIANEETGQLGQFTLLAPELDQEGYLAGVRHGLQNESARLNLNALLLADTQEEGAARELLLMLPGMTPETADAILDWIDEDEDQVRTYGAEAEYYSGLAPPYAPRNGPLVTVEELLLVRGVTPELLFGLDTNRNGQADLEEANNPMAPEVDNSTGSMNGGWASYLTLYSEEKNVDSLGEPRVYVNNDDMTQLHAELSAVFPATWADFIVAYRQYGPAGEGATGSSASSFDIDLNRQGRIPLVQMLDLVGARVRVPAASQDEEPILLESPFPSGIGAMAVYLPNLMDHATVNPSPTIPGRVNINQAPRPVLVAIPGITEEIADQIISQRDPDPDIENVNRQHETWILTEAIVTLEEMKSLLPFVTAGGDVYRTQIVGYFNNLNAFSRVEVVFDATNEVPQVLLYRDLTHLGRGYGLETLGVIVEE